MACYNYILSNSPGYTSAGWFSWTNCDGTQESQWISDTPIHVCAQEGTITDTATDSVYTGGTVVCAVNTASINVPNQVVLTLDDVGSGCHEFQIFNTFSSSANLIETVSSSSLSAGYVLEGNDIHEIYTVCCLDDSGVKQSCVILSNCSPADTGSSDLTNLTPIECDGTKTYSGNQVFPAIYEVELGTDTGTVSGSHNAYSIPDKFIIKWSGSIVYNSGYVGSTYHQNSLDQNLIERDLYGSAPTEIITNMSPIYGGAAGFRTFQFEKDTPLPNKATVEVYGPLPGTAWEMTISCPSGSAGAPPIPTNQPTNGGACLTGTTVLTKTSTPSSPTADVSFTLADGQTALVYLTGSFHQGYLVGGSNMTLLDASDNLIQRFHFNTEDDMYGTPTPPSYYPESIEITGSTGGTTYKLSHDNTDYMSNANGEGEIHLFATECLEKANHVTGVNHTIGDASATTVKVVWPSTDSAENYEKAIDAQDLMEFLTGRVSPASNTNFTFDYELLVAGGINIYDEATDDHVGTINFNSGAQVRWWNENPVANEVVILFQNVTTSGDIAAGFIPLELYKFRIK